MENTHEWNRMMTILSKNEIKEMWKNMSPDIKRKKLEEEKLTNKFKIQKLNFNEKWEKASSNNNKKNMIKHAPAGLALYLNLRSTNDIKDMLKNHPAVISNRTKYWGQSQWNMNR